MMKLELLCKLEQSPMSLLDQVKKLLERREVSDFSLEAGQGETYSHMKPTLYGHGEYPRSSVLSGRPKRVWIEQWATWEEARNACKELQATLGKKFVFSEWEGSSHISMDQMVSHLPDDEDY